MGVDTPEDIDLASNDDLKAFGFPPEKIVTLRGLSMSDYLERRGLGEYHSLLHNMGVDAPEDIQLASDEDLTEFGFPASEIPSLRGKGGSEPKASSGFEEVKAELQATPGVTTIDYADFIAAEHPESLDTIEAAVTAARAGSPDLQMARFEKLRSLKLAKGGSRGSDKFDTDKVAKLAEGRYLPRVASIRPCIDCLSLVCTHRGGAPCGCVRAGMRKSQTGMRKARSTSTVIEANAKDYQSKRSLDSRVDDLQENGAGDQYGGADLDGAAWGGMLAQKASIVDAAASKGKIRSRRWVGLGWPLCNATSTLHVTPLRRNCSADLHACLSACVVNGAQCGGCAKGREIRSAGNPDGRPR